MLIRGRTPLLLAGLSLLIALPATPPTYAQTVPQDIASISARLYRLVEGQLASSVVGTQNQEVARRTNSALRRAGLRYWARSNVIFEGAATQAGEILGIDVSTAEGAAELSELINLPSQELEEALNARSGGEAAPEDIEDIITRLDGIRSPSDARTGHVVDLGDGETVKIRWDPRSGTVSVRARGDGSAGNAAYEGHVTGSTKLIADPETGDFTIEVSARSSDAVTLLTARRLEQLSASIFGEWKTPSGDIYLISAQDESAGDIRVDASSFEPLIEEAETEIAQIENAKEFLWVNRETGDLKLQEKFRRLDTAVWEYEGERYKNDRAEAEIAALKDKIARMRKEQARAAGAIGTRQDPADFEGVAQSKDARKIRIEVREPWNDNHAYVYDEAVFDGRRIAGKGTFKVLADYSNLKLPMDVRMELAAAWTAPRWLEIEVDFDPVTGDIVMAGKRWTLKVRYSRMGGPPRVMSLETPYYYGVQLQKPGSASQWALAATESDKP